MHFTKKKPTFDKVIVTERGNNNNKASTLKLHDYGYVFEKPSCIIVFMHLVSYCSLLCSCMLDKFRDLFSGATADDVNQ